MNYAMASRTREAAKNSRKKRELKTSNAKPSECLSICDLADAESCLAYVFCSRRKYKVPRFEQMIKRTYVKHAKHKHSKPIQLDVANCAVDANKHVPAQEGTSPASSQHLIPFIVPARQSKTWRC